MKLYHGSMIEHLAISNSGTGLGYNFGAMFFARTYGCLLYTSPSPRD